MRRERLSYFQAGLIALAVTALAVYATFTQENPFASHYRISAVFTTAASQLKAHSPVRIAGVQVGVVRKVQRGPGTAVTVDMELQDRGRPVHRDATAKIRPRLFLEGNFFVDLEPGTSAAPEVRDGDSIPLAQTAVPVQFDELLQVFSADTRASLQDLFDGFADSLDKGGAQALNGSFPDWAPAFRDTAISAQALRGERTGDLAGFVRDQARISQTLADRRARLASLLTGYRRTLAAFADRERDVRATLRGADRLLATAPRALAEVDRVLPPLRALTAALRPALRIAPPILDRSRPFLSTAAGVLSDGELPALARDLAPAAQALDRLDARLRPLLPRVMQVSRCVSRNVLPTLNSEVPDGALSTGEPAWQDGLRFGLGLTSAQQNFDGNGFSTRYSFALDENAVGLRLGGAENLVQLLGSPLLGSRPKFTGVQPPLRPDAPCEDQQPPSLVAETAGPPPGQRAIKLPGPRQRSLGQLRSQLRAITKELRK